MILVVSSIDGVIPKVEGASLTRTSELLVVLTMGCQTDSSTSSCLDAVVNGVGWLKYGSGSNLRDTGSVFLEKDGSLV